MWKFNLFGMVLMVSACPYAYGDDWICKEESSVRVENTIHSCGIGLGKDENEARTSAFNNAKSEFERVCKASVDCNNRDITVKPARTTCTQTDQGYQCYRMIVFEIGLTHHSTITKSHTSPISNNSAAEDVVVDSPDIQEHFSPFTLREINKHPKVTRGMSKKDLFLAFGMPDRITQYSADTIFVWFQGRMCVYGSCMVTVKNNEVTTFQDFKPIYDGNLTN